MAKGEDVATWQVQEATSDGSVGSGNHPLDRKMSATCLQQRAQQQQTTAQEEQQQQPNGTDEALSIVKQGETDRLEWPNFQSSERFVESSNSTDVSHTNSFSPVSRVDTTNAVNHAQSLSSSFRHAPHHSSDDPSQILEQPRQLTATHQFSFSNHNNTNNTTIDNTHNYLSSAFSDYHLEEELSNSTSGQEWHLPSGTINIINNSEEKARFDSQSGTHHNLAFSSSSQPQQQQQEFFNSNPLTTSTTTTITTDNREARGNTESDALSQSDITTRMGYNDHHGEHSSWALEDGKMDRTHEDKNRDGDDSTVQSTAVLSPTGSVHGEDVDDDVDHLSPASTPRISPSAGPDDDDRVHDTEGEGGNQIGTPSTVSTAPSTEDMSLSDSIDKIGLKLDPNQLEPFTLHRRAPSWDRSPITRNLYANTEISHNMQPTLHQIPSAEHSQQQQQQPQPYWGMPHPQQQQQQLSAAGAAPSPAQAFAAHHQQLQPQPHHTASSPWGNPQSRIATFRTEQSGTDASKHDSRAASYQHSFAQLLPPPPPPPQHHHQPQQQPVDHQQRWHHPPPNQQHNPYHQAQQQQHRGVHSMQQHEGMGYRQNPNAAAAAGYNPYHPAAVQQHPRKSGFPPQHQQPPTAQSPARAARATQRGTPGAPSPHRPQNQPGGASNNAPSTGGGGTGGGPSSRSSSEILKTLLRKKACLYEPDTSRAVALVTWLVGRELALEHGYFSRQQLQAGVHACVAEKIDSGTITRTKVNRCMQIILNSCFHYIIPRPDGTEEKGHTFRATFEREVYNDASLLQLLPAPWNDLTVDRQVVLDAADGDAKSVSEPRSAPGTPHGSPRVKPKEVARSSPKRGGEAAADRGHHYQQQQHGHGDHHGDDSKRAVLLCFNENVRAAEDVFRCHNEFIRDSAHSSNLQLTAQEWRIFFGKDAASTPHVWGNVGIPVVAVESSSGERKVDVLGQMTPEEAAKFRTTWCAKRYDHDHEFCGMAHVEVNGGWLRRDPNAHPYNDEFCSFITKTADKRIGPNYFVINECPKGVDCEFAHSHEELIYHPNRYKTKTCPSIVRSGACRYGDICPHHHPGDSVRPPKKGDGRPPSSRHGRSSGPGSTNAKSSTSGAPAPSPILYASPAPFSSYERHLHMPGLQSLFRRQCTVVRAHLRNTKCRCCYSYFGDDAGVDQEIPARPSTRPVGLPSTRM